MPSFGVKTGIENTDGERHLSVVLTNDHSDWSVIPSRSPAEERSRSV
jgi:regulation of enolase protein 1 (concanavalin A-like superfamily)